jgi:hypothetical protein
LRANVNVTKIGCVCEILCADGVIGLAGIAIAAMSPLSPHLAYSSMEEK